ncbi:hypothetical protein LZ30DRAFT_172321 [Colletotrichum cereale]|nr:hypothetical protein LZ30DRAFT_172321 [Colletotrichum cereale]
MSTFRCSAMYMRLLEIGLAQSIGSTSVPTMTSRTSAIRSAPNCRCCLHHLRVLPLLSLSPATPCCLIKRHRTQGESIMMNNDKHSPLSYGFTVLSFTCRWIDSLLPVNIFSNSNHTTGFTIQPNHSMATAFQSITSSRKQTIAFNMVRGYMRQHDQVRLHSNCGTDIRLQHIGGRQATEVQVTLPCWVFVYSLIAYGTIYRLQAVHCTIYIHMMSSLFPVLLSTGFEVVDTSLSTRRAWELGFVYWLACILARSLGSCVFRSPTTIETVISHSIASLLQLKSDTNHFVRPTSKPRGPCLEACYTTMTKGGQQTM